MLAPLAVAVEIRALDVGPRLRRAFRLSRAISEDGLSVEHDLPFEAGRPVSVELYLPDDPVALHAVGRVAAVAPDDQPGDRDGERPRPRAVSFTRIDPDDRVRLVRYVGERLSTWPNP